MVGNDRPARLLTPQTVLGVLIIVVGLLLTAGNFGWTTARDILGFWPVGVCLVGVSMYQCAPDRSARFSAFVVFAVGLWLLIARWAGLPAFSRATVLPLVLVMVGTAILARAWREQTDQPGVTDQVISDFVFWSGIQRNIASPLFRRADFTAVMGGIEVDLRQASTAGEAIIDVFVVMGGLEIRVPPDWTVSNQMVAIMGGAVDKSTGTKDAKNRLIIRGFVLMGGVEVKS